MNDDNTPQQPSWIPQPGEQLETQSQIVESPKPTSKTLSRGASKALSAIIVVVLVLILLAALFSMFIMGIPSSNGTRTPIINFFMTIGLGMILPIFVAITLLKKIDNRTVLEQPVKADSQQPAKTNQKDPIDFILKTFLIIMAVFILAIIIVSAFIIIPRYLK